MTARLAPRSTPEECERLRYTGRHDWRVDPQQVIEEVPTVNGPPVARIEVVCASCLNAEERFASSRRYINNPEDPRTWRPYVEGA